ncbi:hypothetical protein [Nostoc sp. ChiQUE01b]|uniref:hypothetical protein n=1 Tax=Nostoc sp. ChiQUE01b TaxID=3075376 RepID=UPI002AD5A732|nr:hypothetical protein [Nostoc sp. ChiQUE01b]
MCRISETLPLSMGNAIPLREIYNIAHLIIAMSTTGVAAAPPTLKAIERFL